MINGLKIRFDSLALALWLGRWLSLNPLAFLGLVAVAAVIVSDWMRFSVSVWLLGAVVAFYFGARETHYFRNRSVVSPYAEAGAVPEENAALEEWRQG